MTPPPDPASDPRPVSSPVSETRPGASPNGLVLTGERTLPGIPDEQYWFQRHVIAYEQAAREVAFLAADSPTVTVLDAGCGEGYGLVILADAGATRVIGVDLEPPVITHVQTTYADADPRIEAVRADLTALPFPDDHIDLTVSFQVIEHLHDIPGYLASLMRVTRPGGHVWIATPNRLTFTPDSDVPVNPFHIREFTATEFQRELTAAGLVVDQVLGVHHGDRLLQLGREQGRLITELLTVTPAVAWDDDLRAAVHATTPEDFVVQADDLDASLDLLALARVPDERS